LVGSLRDCWTPSCRRLDALLGAAAAAQSEDESPSDSDLSAFSRLKGDVGRVALASVERQIEKLAHIERLVLPTDLLSDPHEGPVALGLFHRVVLHRGNGGPAIPIAQGAPRYAARRV
jgi:hypothetical protein